MDLSSNIEVLDFMSFLASLFGSERYVVYKKILPPSTGEVEVRFRMTGNLVINQANMA